MTRIAEFKANEDSNEFIRHINHLVSEGEDNLNVEPSREWPVFFVVGPPRSGTTVLVQWLTHIGLVTPGNLAARFYGNPYFAGLLQRMLTDNKLNYKNELSFKNHSSFLSEYGKTSGLLEPHEFSFYFRRFFPVSVGEPFKEYSHDDLKEFIRGLRLFATALERPVVLKGLLIQYAMEIFNDTSSVIFVYLQRNEIDNICSLYRQRMLVAGSYEEWISVRPPQYKWLKNMSAIEQVAGQVHYTNKEIERQLDGMPDDRKLVGLHEDFCKNPAHLYSLLNEMVVQSGFDALPDYAGPNEFKINKYEKHSEQYISAKYALEKISTMEQ